MFLAFLLFVRNVRQRSRRGTNIRAGTGGGRCFLNITFSLRLLRKPLKWLKSRPLATSSSTTGKGCRSGGTPSPVGRSRSIKVLATRMKQDTNKSNHALTVHISLSGLCVERLVDFSIGVAVRGDLRLRLQLVDTYQPIV